eukprot:GEZU01025369.1.p2 GENE.GEZU01025369.1~~GEZU01025369.1.p2  ORF type:complete len:144 (+),score=24.17 GEZU01025369.1:40-471(+)
MDVCMYMQSVEKVVNIVQNVPIKLLTYDQVNELREPTVPDPLVQIFLPPLKDLKNFIDRMRSVSDYLTLIANMANTLRLKVETSTATIETYFRNLNNPKTSAREAFRPDPSVSAEAKLDIKKFSKFLYCHLIQPQNVCCSKYW